MSEADLVVIAEIEQFLYREARYQDQHQYDDWEALWTDDAVYWVPANGNDIDPEKQMSILYDNRSRIALRIKQLHTGKRHTQTPPSQLLRVVSNVELLESTENEYKVSSAVVIYESNTRSDTVWAARNEHTLRQTESGLRMARKKVMLVNNDKALFTLSFLI
jgi:3-phenylpropionate/cinnamic acid dioxygenase small subunit